jgi:mono/diheme cytochrome c family protein
MPLHPVAISSRSKAKSGYHAIMRSRSIGKALLVGCAVLLACRIPAGGSPPAPATAEHTTAVHGLLHATRLLSTDLEITGMVAGLEPGSAAYIRYADLARLPQVHATVADDPDYPGVTMHATGVYLDVLAKAVGALPSSDLIDALCTDRYRSHYPADAIAAHHPFLALTLDGLTPAAWAARTHQYDPAPYLILYSHFTPAFRVLSHIDRPQLPTNLVRLNFGTTAATFGAIAPRGDFPPNSPEQQGFAIARQNCLRCHWQGEYGGTKGGRDWTALSTWAREQPAYFAAYIHNPQAIEPHAHMPANPEYDQATLAALTAYFRTFTLPPSALNTMPHLTQEVLRK